MESLPTCLRLTGRNCLVVGDSASASAAASTLQQHGAMVTMVATCHQSETRCRALSRPFNTTDLDDCWLVIAACADNAENTRIARACEVQQVLCHSTSNALESSISIDALESQATIALPEFSSAWTAAPVTPQSPVRVSLVGAGPGDPDLLTIRALRLIQSAEVIVYDRLVSKSILALCNAEAEFIYAGKAKANHALPQDSINQLLVDLAQSHRNVVRLKGGDPFIFGRGGEEIETLTDHQVSFQVVPGITAASGCSAFSGIPLTHRDHAQSCVFVTGHLKDGQINLNWKDLRDPNQTIVVGRGLTGLRRICETLVEHGRAGNTPAALIEQGTTSDQRVLASTLSALPDLVDCTDVGAPTLLIIGGVVSLREKLGWFETGR